MKARALGTLVGAAAMLGGLLMATPAQAATTSVYSPDGGALGQVSVAASGTVTLIARDKSCDGRGAVLHYRISGAWSTLSDGSCHGDVAVRGPFMPTDSRIYIYVCNTNTRTGYKSCSSTKTIHT
ncbi:hypothetical protein ACWGID_16810 [Kribbella sp. NPDC054772]